MIEIKFEAISLDTTTGLLPYMSTLVSSNMDLVKYSLKKVPAYWGYKEDGFIYFMIAPPWAKLVVNDVVNSVHVQGVVPKYKRVIN